MNTRTETVDRIIYKCRWCNYEHEDKDRCENHERFCPGKYDKFRKEHSPEFDIGDLVYIKSLELVGEIIDIPIEGHAFEELRYVYDVGLGDWWDSSLSSSSQTRIHSDIPADDLTLLCNAVDRRDLFRARIKELGYTIVEDHEIDPKTGELLLTIRVPWAVSEKVKSIGEGAHE